MDIPIKKKPFCLKYIYHLTIGSGLIIMLIYLVASSIGGSKLRYDSDKLQIVEVEKNSFLDYLDVEGLAQPKLTVKLNSRESGIVEQIVAEEGSMLNRGDTILILSNTELVRTIDDERDNLEKQYISFEEKNIQMKRRSSELKRTTLKTLYDLKRLEKQHDLDKEEYKIGIKSKAQLEVSSDDYEFNQTNAKLLLEELRHDSLMNSIQTDLMKNDLNREEKRFGRNKERISNLVVRAPISGQLSFLSITPGEHINAGANIGELKVVEEIKLSAKINEYYIDKVILGLPATITYMDEKYPLKVTRINPEIKDRQFTVDLIFTQKLPENIRIGKSYRLQIELGQPENALTISKGNFYQATGGQWIFKLNEAGDKAIRTDIMIGRQNPRQYEILDGLSEGDKIIITGYENFGEAKELILK